jgi:hypothetical protein
VVLRQSLQAQRIDRELTTTQPKRLGNPLELERLIAQGLALVERRNAFAFFRDHPAELYAPRPVCLGVRAEGSQVNHRALAAAMIDKVPQVAFKPDWTRHKNSAPPPPGA